MPNPDTIFPIWVGVWIALGIAAYILFSRSKNVVFKEKAFVPFNIGVGVLFIFFLYLMSFPTLLILIAIPFTILITVLNIKINKFCQNCGKLVANSNPFSKTRFCPQCGSSLDT